MTESDERPDVTKLESGTSTGDATRALLEHAALDLLAEKGVLAGLNLREVAERAGVNRALVYHHFGSRDELLRSALKRDMASRMSEIAEGLSLPFNSRLRQMLRTMVRHQRALQLAFLLLLDGKEPVKLGPLKDEWLRTFVQDIEQGVVDPATDTEALVVLMSALSYGYVLIRESIAEEIGIEPVNLDWRVDALLEQLLQKGVES